MNSVKEKGNVFEVVLEVSAKSLSQLITILTGMLRYSIGSLLRNIEVISFGSKKKKENKLKGPLFGIILKPSLEYSEKNIRRLINYSIKYNVDFLNDGYK